MSFEKGQEKTPGSGRRKGIPNKRTNKVIEILKEQGYDPLIEAVKMLQKETLTATEKTKLFLEHQEYCVMHGIEPENARDFLQKIENQELTAKERLDGHIKLIKYIYPARKAIEVTTDDGKEPPKFTISLKPPGE